MTETGVVFFCVLNLLLYVVTLSMAFDGRLAAARVVDRKMERTRKGDVGSVLLEADGTQRWSPASPRLYHAVTAGATVYMVETDVLGLTIHQVPQLTPEAAWAAVRYGWLIPLLVSGFMGPALWMVILRPRVYRQLASRGTAVAGRLAATSLEEYNQGLAQALAEEDDPEPSILVRMPVWYEYRDAAGVAHRRRMAGYNGQPVWAFDSPDVTVLYDPRRPGRSVIYEAIGCEVER